MSLPLLDESPNALVIKWGLGVEDLTQGIEKVLIAPPLVLGNLFFRQPVEKSFEGIQLGVEQGGIGLVMDHDLQPTGGNLVVQVVVVIGDEVEGNGMLSQGKMVAGQVEVINLLGAEGPDDAAAVFFQENPEPIELL